MIYTVTWVPSEKARLATLWNNAIDQQEVTDSSDRIDVELRLDPDPKGSRSGTDGSTPTTHSPCCTRSILVIAR